MILSVIVMSITTGAAITRAGGAKIRPELGYQLASMFDPSNLMAEIAPHAPWLVLVAAVVALGFRRNRFVFVCLSLGAVLLAGPDVPGVWWVLSALVLLASALPEPALLSFRSALFCLACAALAVRFDPLIQLALQLNMVIVGSWRLEGALFGVSLVVLTVRWLLRGYPLDLYLGLAVAPLLMAAFRGDWALASLALSAIALALAVLVGAYRMAYRDALTGLPNRRALDETLSRSGGRIAVAMVDVDHFKKFNDRYGHDAGDRVLRIVARELKRARGGKAFRYGGEEFAIVFEGSAIESADEALEAVRGAIEGRRVRLGPRSGGKSQAVRRGAREGEVSVTVSMGLAQRDRERRTCDAIVDAADKALYRSKQRGRNRLTLAPAARAA